MNTLGHRPALTRFGNLFLIVALLFATGSQWVALQSVAWIGMVANYSEHASFTEALAKTFDGRHPCCLCKAIAAAKKSEKKSEFGSQLPKIEFPPLNADVVLIAPRCEFLRASDSFAQALPQRPLVPPPRGISA